MCSYSKSGFVLGVICFSALLAAGCSRSGKPDAVPLSDISIPGTGVFPESLTSAGDGTVYVGSVGKAQIYRVPPGMSVAEPFIAPGTGGINQVFGVLADDASGTLWACSNVVGNGPPGGPVGPSALHGFDLKSGAPRASFALPAGSFCNDAAVAANGDVYVSDTTVDQVLRLPKGGAALQVWSAPGSFGGPGAGVDGVAVLGQRVIVGTLLTSRLFAVAIQADGTAGAVAEPRLSTPLSRPDGIRSWGNRLLATDSTGKIHHIVIDGDAATVTAVKDGLEGVVAVTVVGKQAYALEGQLEIMMAPPGTTPPAEKPYRAVLFDLP